jgi:hypothetical protein
MYPDRGRIGGLAATLTLANINGFASSYAFAKGQLSGSAPLSATNTIQLLTILDILIGHFGCMRAHMLHTNYD